MKTHDGSRDFGCDLCGCRFTTSGSLKRHMIVHNDERYSKLQEKCYRLVKGCLNVPYKP